MRARTLLLITEHRIARIDLRLHSGVTIESMASIERPVNDSLEPLIQGALSLAPNPPYPVLLFSTDFWTGRVSIPADLNAIANTEELHQAAILEAEIQSGVPAFQSQVAIHQIENDLKGDPQYWVTQFPESHLECITTAFQSKKVRWLGVANPNHLDRNLDNEAFESDSEIQNWVRRIGPEIAAKSFKRPVFTPPKKAITLGQQNLLAAVVAAMVSTICSAIYFLDCNTNQKLEVLSKTLTKQTEETDVLNRAVIKAEASLAEKRKKFREDQVRLAALQGEMDRGQQNYQMLSDHCSNLIDAIACSADPDSWLRRIESKEYRTLLKGIALNEASAHRFASALELHPKLNKHLVSAAQTHALENDLVEFSIAIDLIIAPADTAQSSRSSK